MAVTRPRPDALAFRRYDQGVDVQGTPGAYIRTPGRAHIDAVKADPGGFGEAVYFTELSGVDAGQQYYIGHAAPQVKPGMLVRAGTALVRLLQRPLGNATMPGWAEVGEASAGAPSGPATARRARGFVDRTQNVKPAGRWSFAELEQLWTRNGGAKTLAPVMAAIALSESKGDPHAHNYDPTTGDDSWGFWQINYYGKLRASRTARYGPPQGLTDPDKNARAAIDLAAGGRGLNNWSTYKDGSYKNNLNGASAATTASAGRTRPDGGGSSNGWGSALLNGAEGGLTSALGPVGGIIGLFGGAGDVAGVLKSLLWLVEPRNWLRMVEFLTGGLLMLFSLIGLAVVFMQRSGVVGDAAELAGTLPGPIGATGKAVTVAHAPRRALRQETRRRRVATNRANRETQRQARAEQQRRQRPVIVRGERYRNADEASAAADELERRLEDTPEYGPQRRQLRDHVDELRRAG